jgi:hypothetical protein
MARGAIGSAQRANYQHLHFGASNIPAMRPPCAASGLDNEIDLDAGPKW